MYTLQLQFFPPPFLLLQHEYLDIVLNAIQQDTFAFISVALGDQPEKTFVRLMSENVLPMFSSVM